MWDEYADPEAKGASAPFEIGKSTSENQVMAVTRDERPHPDSAQGLPSLASGHVDAGTAKQQQISEPPQSQEKRQRGRPRRNHADLKRKQRTLAKSMAKSEATQGAFLDTEMTQPPQGNVMSPTAPAPTTSSPPTKDNDKVAVQARSELLDLERHPIRSLEGWIHPHFSEDKPGDYEARVRRWKKNHPVLESTESEDEPVWQGPKTERRARKEWIRKYGANYVLGGGGLFGGSHQPLPFRTRPLLPPRRREGAMTQRWIING